MTIMLRLVRIGVWSEIAAAPVSVSKHRRVQAVIVEFPARRRRQPPTATSAAAVPMRRDQRGALVARQRIGARIPQMDAKDPLVVQIIRQFADRLVEAVELGPIDRIEEYGAEQPVLELGAGLRVAGVGDGNDPVSRPS
jgi:hypothetical protein